MGIHDRRLRKLERETDNTAAIQADDSLQREWDANQERINKRVEEITAQEMAKGLAAGEIWEQVIWEPPESLRTWCEEGRRERGGTELFSWELPDHLRKRYWKKVGDREPAAIREQADA